MILGSSKVDEKMQKDPGRHSRIQEGRWKDSEKNFEHILVSIKVDGKMQKRSTTIF
jgi:hypothetical protein